MSDVCTRSSLRFAFVLVLLATTPTFAAKVTRIDETALEPLRGPVVKHRITLDSLPLADGERAVINLEEFRVWAPGGRVLVHGENGAVTVEAPTPLRFFRGLVNDDPQSFAYFSVNRSGQVYGLIATRENRYSVTAHRRPRSSRPDNQSVESGEAYDHFVTEDEPTDELLSNRTWLCDLDRYKITHSELEEALVSGPKPVALSGTQTYGITIEIETDFEFFSESGSNTTTAQNYVTNLTGAVSTIYNRDLKTNVSLSTINLYTAGAGSDPWAATDTLNGLYELGDYYHSTKSRTTSAVMLLSGKHIGGGIAWTGVICGNDFFQDGHWGGPYSWNGYILGTGSIPDPNGIQDGVQYGMPSSFQSYWPLAEYAHELGHTMGSPHTHCVATTDQERIDSGFTDGSPNNSTSNYIDHCYASEGSGCFSGTNYLAGSQTVFKGTIMSYCHNVFSGTGGAFPQSRFIFGVASEPSHRILDDYLLRPGGPLAGGGNRNIVSGTTASLSSITAPSIVAPSSTGNNASVTNVGGQTYSWSITGGSITAGGSTNSVTFTAGASGNVVLTVDTKNSTNCSLRDSVTVPIGSTVNPPTGVVATATTSTNVSITWTAVGGATNYKVLRSTNGSMYTQVGNPATNSFNDSTALAGTSYLYKVRANDGSSDSGDSNIDLATTVIFTDPVIAQFSTTLKAAHVSELRVAVNAVRTLAGEVAASFTDPVLVAGSAAKALHITELRAALDEARSTLALAAQTYADPTITGGSTLVKTSHMNELRNGVR